MTARVPIATIPPKRGAKATWCRREEAMRHLSSLGNLEQDPNISEWWNSRPIPVPFCGGIALPFAIMLEGEGDPYPDDVEDAVRRFLALTEQDRAAADERVFRYYTKFVSLIPDAEVGIQTVQQVRQHYRPTDVSVSRYLEGDGAVYVRVSCACDWDDEHGLQMVFRGGTSLSLVGPDDGGQFVESS
jgi:hypothetical protein